MTFERNESGNFIINGITVAKEIFWALEPGYSEPEETVFIHYKKGEGRRIRTKTKEYKISGEWLDGNRYIERLTQFLQASTSLSIETQNLQNEINQAVLDSLSYREKRKLEYPALEELVVALWENLIEKKSKKDSGVETLQKLRKAIKSKYSTGNTDAVSTNTTETD
jgi:hypothetical protein